MATEPRDQMERDFVAMFEEGKRKLFEGPGASIPPHMRQEVMRGIKMQHAETGEVICTLADDDYLERFRAACERHQHTQHPIHSKKH